MEELTVNVRMTIAGERNFFLLCGDMFLLVSERNGRQEERKIVYAGFFPEGGKSHLGL